MIKLLALIRLCEWFISYPNAIVVHMLIMLSGLLEQSVKYVNHILSLDGLIMLTTNQMVLIPILICIESLALNYISQDMMDLDILLHLIFLNMAKLLPPMLSNQ